MWKESKKTKAIIKRKFFQLFDNDYYQKLKPTIKLSSGRFKPFSWKLKQDNTCLLLPCPVDAALPPVRTNRQEHTSNRYVRVDGRETTRPLTYTKNSRQLKMLRVRKTVFPLREPNNWLSNTKCSTPKTYRQITSYRPKPLMCRNICVYTHTYLNVTTINEKGHKFE